jgi:hypothetical protein
MLDTLILIAIIASASGASGFAARYFARKPLIRELNALDDEATAQSMQHSRDLATLKARHLNEQSELRASLIAQLEDAKHGAISQVANISGHLEEARIKNERADYLLSKHTWRVGGKGEPHNMGPLIKYECTCGASVWATENYFK